MTTRRWLALPAAAAILFAACSGGGGASTAPSIAAPATSAPASSAPAESAPPEAIKIGFVTHVLGNPFIQQIIDGANAAAKDLNVDLQVTGPEGGDADAQLKAVQTLVAAGVQGVATSVPGETMSSALNEIVDSGTPIVQFNLLVTSVKAPYVGERSVESGRILGQKVVEKLGGASATGTVIIGNCFPGFPVLENRARGVQESLKAAAGLKILGPFDVKVAANENYAAWEALLTANPDAKALVGLCAPDIASLGKLQAANASTPFVSGGYDLTAENLTEIKAGNAYVSLGQTPFMQGYLPVKILADTIRKTSTVDLSKGGFLDAGTEIVTADSVQEPFDLPPLTFAELEVIAGSPEKAREYYQPLVDGQIADWASKIEPIANESK
ncbi:MAG: ribose transport system substrate-binding protein [Chloroflexota bacterium]|jgi:ABC-type sugar transport system substrate-binding protein|nr:ribose transport system substrate-binding protein [Chloroflexota bacterium]